MFQTVVDESEVFSNAQLYDNNSYYAVDGCVFFLYCLRKEQRFCIARFTELSEIHADKAALGDSHYGRKPIHIY